MRNFNTSFVKNAIRFFASEASTSVARHCICKPRGERLYCASYSPPSGRFWKLVMPTSYIGCIATPTNVTGECQPGDANGDY